MWTVLPLLLMVRGLYDNYAGMVIAPLGLLALMSALAVWARESMSKTAINRALVRTVTLTMLAQVALHGGSWLVGMPPRMSQVLDLFLWFVLTGMLSIAVDRRLLPGALGYLAAFFAACVWPRWIYLAMSASNLVLTATMLLVWRADGRRRQRR